MFFTAVNPIYIDHYRENDYDVTQPRIAVYKHNWKIHQNTVYWCNLRVAQSKGLQFNQTRSNAIIMYNTLPFDVAVQKLIHQFENHPNKEAPHPPLCPLTVQDQNGPINRREDHQEVKRICERQYQESGKAHHRLHPREQVRMRPDQPSARHDEGSERVDLKTGWKWHDTQPAASSFLRMATVCLVTVFLMVTNKVG